VDNPLPLLPIGCPRQDTECLIEGIDHALADTRVFVWLKALTQEMQSQKVAILNAYERKVIEFMTEAIPPFLVIKFNSVGFHNTHLFVSGLKVAQQAIDLVNIAKDGSVIDVAKPSQILWCGVTFILNLRENKENPVDMVPRGISLDDTLRWLLRRLGGSS
jgi:hypothetical protein